MNDLTQTIVINKSVETVFAFTRLSDNVTELQYRIWKNEGELPTQITANVLRSVMEKFKEVIEGEA